MTLHAAPLPVPVPYAQASSLGSRQLTAGLAGHVHSRPDSAPQMWRSALRPYKSGTTKQHPRRLAGRVGIACWRSALRLLGCLPVCPSVCSLPAHLAACSPSPSLSLPVSLVCRLPIVAHALSVAAAAACLKSDLSSILVTIVASAHRQPFVVVYTHSSHTRLPYLLCHKFGGCLSDVPHRILYGISHPRLQP